jgi:hypothetical protein
LAENLSENNLKGDLWNAVTFNPSECALAEKHLALAEKHLALAEKHLALAEKHLARAEKHLALAEKHLALAEKHLALAEKHLALAEKHHALAEKHHALAEKHLVVIMPPLPRYPFFGCCIDKSHSTNVGAEGYAGKLLESTFHFRKVLKTNLVGSAEMGRFW